MVPGDRPIIAIGYKYNTLQFIYFIITDKGWSIQTGLPYLSKYLEQYSNVSIFPISLTLVMYKFFGSINEVDPHNKPRQSYLELEKFWVTKCGWIRLCTTVDIGMTINNSRKLFHYGFKIYH